MASAYSDLEDFDNAVKFFKESIKYDSKNPDAYVNLSQIYEKRGKRDESLKIIKEEIKKDPSNKM